VFHWGGSPCCGAAAAPQGRGTALGAALHFADIKDAQAETKATLTARTLREAT